MVQKSYFGRRQFLRAAVTGFAAGSLIKGDSQGVTIEGGLPSFEGATGWLNSRALTARELQGKVVAVNFWTYTCINWMRSLPYVRAWSEKYGGQGLVVIGVHTPEFEFEKDTGNVRRAAERHGIKYPIAADNDYAIWRAFNNEYWPALYLVDAKGRVRHHQFGERGHHESELLIRRLLNEANVPHVDGGLAQVEARGVEAAADWTNLRSPETYLNYQRTQGFSSSTGMPHKRHTYAVPARLKLNHWALTGDWTFGKHSVAANKAGGRITYRFHARDVHLVMGPAAGGTAVRFRVLLNGQAPGSAHGVDVDEHGIGRVAEPRLYQLIRQTGPSDDRQFEIEFLDGGAEAFAFTFG